MGIRGSTDEDEEMLERASVLTYRGSLRSCNYSCHYCPFWKHPVSRTTIARDQEQLERFVHKIETTCFEKPIQVLIAPYGEALNYDYYIEQIGRLSRLTQIERVGCQTNLSLDLEHFIKLLENVGADFDKVTLWATYHPTMVTVERFVRQVMSLIGHIALSVGVVGNPESLQEIQVLRDLLPDNIYLWINKLDGLGRTYTEQEMIAFRAIDPLFELELRSQGTKRSCNGGVNHFFVQSNGDMSRCNRMIQPVGNLYTNEVADKLQACSGRRCDCYLAYSHLQDLKPLKFFGGQQVLRVPHQVEPKAIFLDVDGTLTGTDGKITQRTQEVLRRIGKHIPLYLGTELTYVQAMHKCRQIRGGLSGGCFAGGAHLVDEPTGYEVYSVLSELPPSLLGHNVTTYSHEDRPYRLLVRGRVSLELQRYLKEHTDYEVIPQGARTSIVAKGVSKQSGIQKLCERLGIKQGEIMYVGNDLLDIPMLRECGYSVAVPSARVEVKEVATYELEVHQLGYIVDCKEKL
ncbi:MAG: STM4011 family radical SAM protein [Cellulosilyticaceae bacterium]